MQQVMALQPQIEGLGFRSEYGWKRTIHEHQRIKSLFSLANFEALVAHAFMLQKQIISN